MSQDTSLDMTALDSRIISLGVAAVEEDRTWASARVDVNYVQREWAMW